MVRLPLGWPPHTDRLSPRRLLNAALDLLLPPVCVTCAAQVEASGLQCGDCFGELNLLGHPCCHCCGVPFELVHDAMEGGYCQACLDTPPPFTRARAALRYDKAVRKLIVPFKHSGRADLAEPLMRLMAGAGADLLRDADVLVPVPLHRRRLFTRRYNQAALLASGLARRAGKPVILDAIRRIRATASLGGKSASERHEELAGAFAVRANRVDQLAGRRVLLVDDVMTSGATAAACAAVLLADGAAEVDVLAAARVPDPRMRDARRPVGPA